MPNVIAIIQDDRVRRQTEQFLEELGMDDLRFATFKTHKEFSELYFRERKEEPKKEESKSEDPPKAEAPPATEEATAEGADMKLFSDVHLVIFALDSIGEKAGTWAEKLKANFKRYDHLPKEVPLRVILMKYEDDGISKLDVLHPLLDDLLYMPLDRLVFLQKLEIFLNLPKVIKPSFLFNQEIKQEIEISKISKMDRFSDVGLAIRNPIPLKKGLPGHFYLQLPGEKSGIELHAKVFRSEPHPDYPGQYLVYFTYYGLPKADLSTLRRTLSKFPKYQSLFNDDRSTFRHQPNNLFNEPADNKVYGIAVIDPEPAVASNIADQLSKDMDRIKVVSESSYSLFLHKYFEARSDSHRTPPRATEASDFFNNPIVLNVAASDLKCTIANSPPKDGDLFLGHPAIDLFGTPDKWISLISDKASRLVLEEAIQLTLKLRSCDRLLVFQDNTNSPRAINCKFAKAETENLVTITMTPASLSDVATKMGSDQTSKELEALILDAAFVPEDPTGWIEGLRTRAKQVGLVRESKDLKFLITAEPEARLPSMWLNIQELLGVFIKPVDPRQMMFVLSLILPNKDTVYQFENIGWASPLLNVHVSKNIQLEALSEFGATLKSRTPLAAGTIIYLRKAIYDSAPNQCLAARVYACEPHASEKDYFQVYVTYYGIGDQFLKFARTWIRENYAQQKGKENG